MSEMKNAIPAATLVLYHEPDDGPARHLLVERSAAMAFAPGKLVFPGGRVDPGDHEIAASPALALNAPADAQDAAGRVAAIREAIEEVGVAAGFSRPPAAEFLAQWRVALHGNVPFKTLLEQAGQTLDLGKIVPFARWWPKLNTSRHFDTRFYVARVEGEAVARHDDREVVRHEWLSAAAAIAAEQKGQLMFPTRCNLQRLALYPRFDSVLAHLRAFPVRVITPVLRMRGGEEFLCIPEDAGYPVTQALLAAQVRA